ncbi:MAG TPA: spore coat U domain-containing protein, partial [Anaeromyxobacteraceae bacterium]
MAQGKVRTRRTYPTFAFGAEPDRRSNGAAVRLGYHAGVPTSLRALACAVALASPLGAHAAGRCTSLSATGIAFGSYNTFSTTALDAAGTLTWRCPGAGAIRATLSRGASTTFINRTMVRGAEHLAYNVYLDPARTTVFGDGSGGTSAMALSGGGQQKTASVYGRVFAQQDVSAGTYTDTL